MDPNQPLSAEPVHEDELHALVDARLSVDERLAVEARLARDPAAAATRAAWQLQRDALRDLYRPLQEQPLPAPLAAAARHAAQAQHALGQWSRWGGMAAAVVLAFGLGWLSHRQLEYGAGAVSSAGPAARVASAREFASQATLAHAVYAPELRHPVEVTAAQQEHLVQWLSKRLERPLKVPNLSALGYELVGGRLLPGAAGARAQFMYQNAAGERVTLYLGATQKHAAPPAAPATPTAPAPDARETAFSFAGDGPVPGFYWVDQGFGYALSGPLSRERLLALAQSVYAQL